MKWNEFKKLAIQKGWEFDRKGHKHDLYKKKGRNDILAIERHWSEEVKPGLLRRILKQIED